MMKSIKITPDECRESFSVNFFIPFFVSLGLADTHAQFCSSRLTLKKLFFIENIIVECRAIWFFTVKNSFGRKKYEKQSKRLKVIIVMND